MVAANRIDEITSALTDLESTLAEQADRRDRIGACLDNPDNPTVIVRVKHGKILDIVASDAIDDMEAKELQNVINAVIFGAFIDWHESVKSK